MVLRPCIEGGCGSAATEPRHCAALVADRKDTKFGPYRTSLRNPGQPCIFREAVDVPISVA